MPYDVAPIARDRTARGADTRGAVPNRGPSPSCRWPFPGTGVACQKTGSL